MKKLIIATAFVLAFAANVQAQQKQTAVSKTAVTAVADTNEVKYKELIKKAGVLLDKEDFKKAAKVYTEAMAYSNERQHTLALRAMAYKLNHDYKLAIADANAYIEAGGEELAQVYFIRATSKLGLQDKEGACEDLIKAKELGHDVRWEGYFEVCGN